MMDINTQIHKSSSSAVKRVKSKHGDYGKHFECDKGSSSFATNRGLSMHLKCHKKGERSPPISEQMQISEAFMPRNDDQTTDVIQISANDLEFEGEGQDFQPSKTRPSNKRKVCDFCHKSFANAQVLKTHMRRHTGERPYFCTLCDKTFTQKNGLIVHMHTHANEEFKCQECGVVFTQLRSLKRHSKFHTGEVKMKRSASRLLSEFRIRVPQVLSDKGVKSKYKNVFRCDFCGKDFNNGSQLMIHRRVHTNERPFECGICQRRFKQKITLRDHESTHFSEKCYKCDQCGSMFKQQRTLRQHQKLQICQQKINKRIDQEETKLVVMQCQEDAGESDADMYVQNINNSNVDSEKDVARDSTENQDKVKVECFTTCILDCKQGTMEIIPCEKDVEPYVNHASTEKEEDAIPMYVCEYCRKVFKTKRSVLQHQKTHSNERPFSCGICLKTFKMKSTLMEHIEIHNDGKPHPCQTCGKQFKTRKCLQNHMGRNICTGTRPYVCEKCNKSFMYVRFLEKHRCSAAEPKTFDCDECLRKFTRRNLLTEHKRVHTGERPLECEHCGKKFAKRDLLRRHRLTHKEKQFQCQECGKRLTRKSALQVHMAIHSKDYKTHVCEICSKTFKQVSSLHNHLKTVHTLKSSRVEETKPQEYICAYCGKVFKHLRWMLKHFCPASGVKRFQCSVCSKSFDKKQQLEVHTRTHTGLRPYKCEECGKCFTQTNSLKDHMVTHTGEKNFKCDLCNSAFTRKNSLQRHRLIIHEGVEPFICKKCGLTFKYQKSFNAHVNACEVVAKEHPDSIQTEIVQDVVNDDRQTGHGPDFEQQVLDNILGNIERAMNGAGIEIRPDVQYQIIVGESDSEVTVHVTGEPKLESQSTICDN
ncbi:zinc finger protein 585A-like [Lytechinus variegatus]|uniref:zinc finger protein 585A-like n=1 Tax=Lytechinus variegatus TaxID=7654 RepID=UPI001BB1752E|nr:zinc finger protein 585A-like [Lytechinus variegatus]